VEEEIKKSRFIGVLLPCADEDEVTGQLKKLHTEHPNASHICYAYRIKTQHGINYRFYDAGEPSGSAGKPIFHHLDGKQLINLLVVVVRYFGGIKLGTGGLARAYGNVAKAVIESAEILPFIEQAQLNLRLDYQQLSTLEYALKKWDGQILSQEFAAQVQVVVQLPKQHAEILLKSFPNNY
jgi:uncharacterized YigZ family protein